MQFQGHSHGHNVRATDTGLQTQGQGYRHNASYGAEADTVSGLTQGHNARATDTGLQTQ